MRRNRVWSSSGRLAQRGKGYRRLVFSLGAASLLLLVSLIPPLSPLPVGALAGTPSVSELRKAAEAGDTGARFRLGTMYEKGLGVKRDYAEALKWYMMAAREGHIEAQVRLGAMYAEGLGVDQDYKVAAMWFKEAAERGNAEAQYRLGVMHSEGEGVPKDRIISYMWLNLAVAGGYEAAVEPLDKLEAKMTEGEVELAQKLSREFVAKE